MATYQDFTPKAEWTPEKMYGELENLLIGSYSVEVVRLDEGARIFRVWSSEHCDLSGHQEA